MVNEHQPFKADNELRRPPRRIVTAADEKQALMSLKATGRRALRQVLVCDFDSALCGGLAFDVTQAEPVPVLDPEAAWLAEHVPLVVTTARLARSHAVETMRMHPLRSSWLPIIAENGGVTITGPAGTVVRNFNDDNKIRALQTWADEAAGQVKVPLGERLVVRHGETMSSVWLQDDTGNCSGDRLVQLRAQLKKLHLPRGVVIGQEPDSLSVQSETVSKARAFKTFLERMRIDRDRICVTSVSGTAHDTSMFAEADLSIGVDHDVKRLVDIGMSRGVASTKTLLKLGGSAELFRLAEIVAEREGGRPGGAR